MLDQIERFLASRPEVDKFGGVVGGFGGGEVNSGFAFVTMKDPPDRPRDPKTGHKLSQHEFMGVVRQATSGDPGRAHRDAGLLAARLQPRRAAAASRSSSTSAAATGTSSGAPRA